MVGDKVDTTAEKKYAKVQSMKTEVVEILFRELWPDGEARPAIPLIANNNQVVAAIRQRNKNNEGNHDQLSDKNVHNFLKDFIRKPSCNTNWPKFLKDRRITARQVYGNKQVLEFVDYPPDDTDPFPDRYEPTPDMPIYPFEVLSLPLEARQLGRQDEPWLIQVAVSQKVVHSHLAIYAAEKGLAVETLSHLQTSVKTQPEIDATFFATLEAKTEKGEKPQRIYICCEAKQIGERILEDQIREQVKVAFAMTGRLDPLHAIDAVLPVVLKVVMHPTASSEAVRGIYVAQFETIYRADFDKIDQDKLHELSLRIQSRALHVPHPQLAGISYKPKNIRKSKAKS